MWDVLRDGGKEILVESEDLRREVPSDIVVSPAGDRFVSISVSGRCLLWKAETGQVVADLSSAAVIDAPSENRTHATLPSPPTAHGWPSPARNSRSTKAGPAPSIRQADACRGDRVHCVGLRDDGGATLVVGNVRTADVRRVTSDLEVWEDVPIDGPLNPVEVAAFTSRGLVLTGRTTQNAPALPTAAFGPAPRQSGGRHLCSQGCRSGRRLPYRDPESASNATRRPAKTDDGGNDRVIEVAVAGVGRPHTAPSQPNSRTPVRAQCGHHRVQPVGRYPCRRLPATRRQNDLRGRRCTRAARGNDPGRRLYVRPSGRPRVRRGGVGIYPRRREADFGKRTAPRRGSARVDLLGSRHHVAFPLEDTVPAAVTAITVSPDGTRLVVGGMDGMLRLLPIDSPGSSISTFNVGHRIAAAASAHHRSLVAVTDSTDRVRVFDVSDKSITPRAHFDQLGQASRHWLSAQRTTRSTSRVNTGCSDGTSTR